MGYFMPTDGELHIAVTSTPSTPYQLALNTEWPVVDLRVLMYNSSASTEVQMAYGQTAAIVAAIAGAGGDTATGKQNAGILTFGCASGTYAPGVPDFITLPAGSFISVWTAVAATTADCYICPGIERAH